MTDEIERPHVDVLLVGEAAGRLSRPLTGLGYRSVHSTSAAGALQMLDRESVLALIADLDVTDIDLKDLMPQVRERQPHAATLVLAPPERSHEIVAALAHGFDSFLPSPPGADLLIDRMERFLAGALVRWQQADEDDGELFVDEAPTFEWGAGPPPGGAEVFAEGTEELEGAGLAGGRPATVSRESVSVPSELLPDRAGESFEPTVNQPPPPVDYDPANFPPQVHEVPTGPVSAAGELDLDDDDDDARQATVSVMITNPAAARSIDGVFTQSPGSMEEEALGFEEGEATLALDQEAGSSSSLETSAGVRRPKKR